MEKAAFWGKTVRQIAKTRIFNHIEHKEHKNPRETQVLWLKEDFGI
jgi:hypothetical protein